MSGSDNAADIAERRKLEAELYEAREGLDDTYYSHAKDAQQQALEDEAQAYEESMNRFVQGLRDALEAATQDMNLFMQGVLGAVTTNAPAIKKQYEDLGLSLDGAIIDPWTAASEAIKKYQDGDGENLGLAAMNSWIGEGGIFPTFKTDATSALTSPWTEGSNAIGAFQASVSEKMAEVVKTVQTNVATAKSALSSLYTDIKDTSVTSPPPGGGGDTGGGGGGGGGITYSAAAETLQKILNDVFGAKLEVDGKWGPKSEAALKKAQTTMSKYLSYYTRGTTMSVTGKFDAQTRKGMLVYFDHMATTADNNDHPEAAKKYRDAKKKLPAAFHAKGTLGTTRDEFAITDESWIGEEITLAAGKNGQLQYLKKGSAVMPADISANLVEWGKLNPNIMNMGGAPNLNMISNAINKPEFNLDIENFLRCDNVSQDSMPELKRFVNEQMNSLIKQMNYSLKKSGAR